MEFYYFNIILLLDKYYDLGKGIIVIEINF